MTTLTISIIVVFVLGYALIATERLTKVNKAAIALLMLVGCWTLYMVDPMQYLQMMHPDYTGGAAGMVEKVTGIIQEHLGDTATTLFFLMGAMTIVEIVDQNGGFNWVRKVMKTKSKRALLWRIAFLTFFLSAILDNLTTSIVMIMILRKLVTDHKDRMIYASLVIIAANSGGAFSPIGDVTTIMLWNKGLITAAGVIAEIFIPSVVSMVIPALILQTMLKGELVMPEVSAQQNASVSDFTEGQRKAVFWLGVGGLIFVPIFKSITHLPPFVGILFVLGVLWTATEVFYRSLHRGQDAEGTQKRVTKLLSRVDMSTILFFLGILMAVLSGRNRRTDSFRSGTECCLRRQSLPRNRYHWCAFKYCGQCAAHVIAKCMGMYPVAAVGDMAVDGIFWQLLAYCAGVGGSMLIIGSAAGVVVMGLEKITFGWYMKHISWIAFVGYLAGIVSYWFIRTFLYAV